MEWYQEGDVTLEKRLNLFQKQEMTLKEEIEKLQKSLAMIQYKKKYYASCLENKNKKNMDLLLLILMIFYLRRYQ